MASAGVLKFQVSRTRQESSGQSWTKKGASRQRRPLNCLECRTLKVSCDRKSPCSRCKWRGKAEACSYAPLHHTGSENLDQGEQRTWTNGFSNDRATSSTYTAPQRSPLSRDDTSLENLRCLDQIWAGLNPLFPQLAFELRLASTLTGMYQQLSCVLEFMNNPLREPSLVQRGQTHWQGILHQVPALGPKSRRS